jgi:hypothetical protein
MYANVILAAGFSTRLNNKMLLPTHDGQSVIQTLVQDLKQDGVVYVVIREDSSLLNILKGVHFIFQTDRKDVMGALKAAALVLNGKRMRVFCGDNIYPSHLYQLEGEGNIIPYTSLPESRALHLSTFDRSGYAYPREVKSKREDACIISPWLLNANDVLKHDGDFRGFINAKGRPQKVHAEGWWDIGDPNVYDEYQRSRKRMDVDTSLDVHPPAMFVRGRMSTLEEAHHFLRTKVWTKPAHCDPNAYWDYMCGVSVYWEGYISKEDFSKLKFTSCVAYGDATLENFVTGGDEVYGIDPGRTHGLNCRELDEAKLLQSWVMHWETRVRGRPVSDEVLPFTPNNTHRILLVSHWMRLLRHWPEFEFHKDLGMLMDRDLDLETIRIRMEGMYADVH